MSGGVSRCPAEPPGARRSLQMPGGLLRCPVESPDVRQTLQMPGARPLVGHYKCIKLPGGGTDLRQFLAEMGQNVRRS